MTDSPSPPPSPATPTLAPCPFCGKAAVVVDDDSYGGCWVGCASCDVSPDGAALVRGPGMLDKAIAVWNRRAPDASTDALQSRLEEVERDAARYRFWRTHQYGGLLDVDEYCDPNSPQAIHFDRLTDAALAGERK